jgi:hypothetical protein
LEPAREPVAEGRTWLLLAAVAGVLGLALIWDSARSLSATYDEVTYLEVGARWWRDGERVGITRMGSPLLFWKLQQAPVYWALDRLGRGALIDDPIRRQAELLPMVRIGASWIWLAGLSLTAWWARLLNGPTAGAAAAWLYALSPNLLAHGALITMEAPLVAASTSMLMAFWAFLKDGRRRWFWASAILGGLAFSCKFSVVLFPPILAVVWWSDGLRTGEPRPELARRAVRIAVGMAAYVAALLLSDFALTGFAVLPLSPTSGDHPSLVGRFGALGPVIARLYETPLPQDWVGFANQVQHQRSGGPSYLLGETRMTGWWYYYLVAAAVKAPLSFWLLAAWRLAIAVRPGARSGPSDRMLVQVMALFLVVTAIGSSRNYGFRYLLPLAPLAIVWVSRIIRGEPGRRIDAVVFTLGLAGQAIAVAAIHPNELTYFHALAGGPEGGRRILADSNLDWGQGLRSLARLQRERPEFRDLTFYYFGDTDPAHYGVVGTCYTVNAVDDHSALPPIDEAPTSYLAVSASLQFGPWAPPGFFRGLDGASPVATTDDYTVAIYRSIQVPAPREAVFQAVGEFGDPPQQLGRVDQLAEGDGEVLDEDEVFLAAEDPDGEAAVGHPGVELQEDAAVAVVDRAADRDEGDQGAALGVDAPRPDVDGLPAVEPGGDHGLPAATRGGEFEAGALDEFADRPLDVGVGGLGRLVRPERLGRGARVGLHAADRQPAAHAEATRPEVRERAPRADDGHGRHRAGPLLSQSSWTSSEAIRSSKALDASFIVLSGPTIFRK